MKPVQEQEKMTQIIVQALEETEQRVIINKGWGGLGDLDLYPHSKDLLEVDNLKNSSHEARNDTSPKSRAIKDRHSKWVYNRKVKARAVELAKAMEYEDGVTGAVKAFFKHLPRKKTDPDPAPETSSTFSISRCFGCA